MIFTLFPIDYPERENTQPLPVTPQLSMRMEIEQERRMLTIGMWHLALANNRMFSQFFPTWKNSIMQDCIKREQNASQKAREAIIFLYKMPPGLQRMTLMAEIKSLQDRRTDFLNAPRIRR